MVRSSLDAPASDLDASFDMRPVATIMPTAGAFSLLEPIVLESGAAVVPLRVPLAPLICKPVCGRAGVTGGGLGGGVSLGQGSWAGPDMMMA